MRNTHAAFHLPGGMLAGMAHSGLSCMITGGKEPWSLRNKTPDADRTRPAKEFTEIAYPKPDGVLSFDLMTNLMRSGEWLWQRAHKMVVVSPHYASCPRTAGTSHDHDQPAHLRVKPHLKHVPSGKQVEFVPLHCTGSDHFSLDPVAACRGLHHEVRRPRAALLSRR